MDTLSYLSSSLQQLPQTTLMGEVRVPGPNRHFKRTPNEWILYLVSDGRMIIQEENRKYSLEKGDMLILSPGKCHFGLPVNDCIHYYYVHFFWKTLEEIALSSQEYLKRKMHIQENIITHMGADTPSDFLLLPKYLHLSASNFAETALNLRQLLFVWQKSLPHQQTMNHCLFLMILLQLSRSEMLQLLPESTHSCPSTLPIMAYLKEHYRNKITSNELERQFHHNYDYMNRRFKENTGATIFQFLEKIRIEESKKLLESKRFSVTEIAEYLGFCNAFYFTRVFKKHENISPSEYKKRH